MNYLKRIKKIQGYLKKKGWDALLVSQPENRRYLCGYSDGDHGIAETSGLLLVPAKGTPLLLTDFRYKLHAEAEVSGLAQVMLYPNGLLKLLGELLPELKINKLAFESHYILHSTVEKLRKEGKKTGFAIFPCTNVIEGLRVVKDEDELKLIQKSVTLNEEVFRSAREKLKPGMTELEFALLIESTMKLMGAEKPSFDSIVASSLHSALPHAVPTREKIVKNKPLTIDMGLVLEGYCSDMTRTFVPGKATQKYKKIHRIVREAQLAGMAAVRAGVKSSKVDSAAREIIEKAGYGKYFGHSLGHGVGLAVHEHPRVSSPSKTVLKEGMVITIEPGVYIPGWGGIRLENMVVVQKDGCLNLNNDTTWLDI